MSDQILIGIISGIAVIIIIGIVKMIKDKSDTNKIISYLQASLKTSDYKLRSNHAIASETNLSEERVRNLCSKSTAIKRNTNEKESWQLVNESKNT